MVYATIEETSLDFYELIDNKDFVYDFYLKSKFIKYKFRVFSFAHDILAYPVYVKYEEDIKSGLGIKTEWAEFKDEGEFTESISKAFHCTRLSKVINAMIQFAK